MACCCKNECLPEIKLPCVQAGRFFGAIKGFWKFNSAAAAAPGKNGKREIRGALQAELLTYFAQHPEESL